MGRRTLRDGDQYLLDLAEVRERLALLARLMDREAALRQEEIIARTKLQEIRRKIKENRWDQRNAASLVRRDGKQATAREETPAGEVIE